MRATLAALVLCLLLATPAGAATLSAPAAPSPDVTHQPTEAESVGLAQSVHTGTGGAVSLLQADQGLSTAETIDVQIREDGDARFTISKAYPAETEAERAAFERIAEEFEAGDRELGLPFFSTVVEDVSEETGRSMSLTDTSRQTPVEDGTGRLVQQFTWTNFATVTGERVEVQDAFQTGDGVWLRSLEPDQELVLRAPEGYGVAHSEPKSSVRGNTVIWEGPQTFQRGDFRTVFDSSPSPFGNGIGDASLLLGAIGVLLLLLTAYLLFRRLQREGVVDAPVRSARSRLAGSIPAGRPERPDDPDGAGQPTPTDSPDASAAETGDGEPEAAIGDESAPDDGEDGVDPELLSDEERVERLLEHNGGRMKQAKIVDETGWSNAKVSQLLSEMAEEEKVDKLRIGRENLITLPDEDVTALE